MMKKLKELFGENQMEKKKLWAFILMLAVMAFWSACWLGVHLYSKLYCLIYSVAVLGIVALILICFKTIKEKKFSYHKAYPFIGLFLGVVYCINLPVYTVPDEPAHLWKAYHMSNQILGVEDYEGDDKLYLMMRQEDDDFAVKAEDYTLSEFSEYWKETNATHSEEMVKTPKTVMHIESYPYIASSVGITLGRLLHLSALKTFLLGRIFNLFLFVFIVTLAMWLLPYGQPILFTVALLPMTIQEGMSYAYDSWVIAHSFLMFALFLSLQKDVASKEKTKSFWIRLAVLTVVSLLFVTIKSHGYILMCTMVAFVYLQLFFERTKVEKEIGFCLRLSYIGVLCGGILALALGFLVPDLFPYTTKTLEWSQTPGYTLGYLLHFPKETIHVIYNTVKNQFDYYHRTMIGDLMGWLEISLNPLVILGFDLALIVASMKEKGKSLTDGFLKRLFFWIVLFTFAVINAGMLISWSPIEVHQVVGLQGRYFLPILPLALYLLETDHVEISTDTKAYLPIGVLLLQFFTLGQLMCLSI